MNAHNPATLDEMFEAIDSLPDEHFEPDGVRPDDATVGLMREAAKWCELNGIDVACVVTNGNGGLVVKAKYRDRGVQLATDNRDACFLVCVEQANRGWAVTARPPQRLFDHLRGVMGSLDRELS